MDSENPKIKYLYFVEILQSGFRIYHERPGRLNKGCDFVIYAEKTYQWKKRNDRPPDHKFVLEDLSNKKNHLKLDEWNNFLLAVTEIYYLKPYSNSIKFTQGLPVFGNTYELSLKLIKWFFIEQDITYWSGDGREMLFKRIQEIK